MEPAKCAKLFTVAAIVLFALTLGRTLYLNQQIDYHPCEKITQSGSVTSTGSSAIVDYYPKDQIGLGARFCVAIQGPANVAVDKDGKPTLHLFFDGLQLKSSVGTVVDRNKNLIVFDVTRTAEDASVWTKVISELEWGSWGARVPLRIGVGTATGEFDNPKPVNLLLVDLWALVSGFAAFIAAILALFFAAQISAVLRDGNAASTYSLARVQMAFWLYLVTAAFIFIWLVTGDYNGVLTAQSLTLIGISSTTALAAINVGNVPTAESAGFLKDILYDGDGDGVSLHRLQIAVWTVILGVVFLVEICSSLRLPTFDSNLLILMGISGVTYVGFKFKDG